MTESADPTHSEPKKKLPAKRLAVSAKARSTKVKGGKALTPAVAQSVPAEVQGTVTEIEAPVPKPASRTRAPASRKVKILPEPTPVAPVGPVNGEKPPEQAALPLDDVRTPKPRDRGPRSRTVAPPLMSPNPGTVEEWSPSRGRKKAAVSDAEAPIDPVAQPPVPAPVPEAIVPRPPSPLEEAPVASEATPPTESSSATSEEAITPPAAVPTPVPPRKYPVYIPRHVAKQMEQSGQQAPLAVPADHVPDEVSRVAVEATRAAAALHASHVPQPRQRHGDRRDPRERDNRDNRDNREPRDQREPREQRQSEPPQEEELGTGEGIVEISGKGFGFLRDPKRGFAQHPNDVFVTPELVRRYNLRDGQWVKGDTRRGGRGTQLFKLSEINGDDPESCRALPSFDELTVISPLERITLETVSDRYTTRIIDLFAPIGKGQRGLIVAPPRTGKTTLLQHIADAVVKNHPDIILIILLVDERPEEVTDIKRTVPSAEVMASSNDSDVKSHTRIAQLAIERAKRLAESGKDVFILLDSITRVGRAFNNAMAGGGRTGSGGLDTRALEIPRKLFAAARNTEEAGSVTIVATALIDTGSRMDEAIFQEFKGTGNMELVLDRKIADMRIYPAVDIFQSGTRREELLIPADDLHKINIIRRGLSGHKPIEAVERLLFFLRKFPSNGQMIREIPG